MRLLTRLAAMFDGEGRGESGLGGHVATGAGPIHYLADGPRKGAPVVLLHGASGNLRDWTLSIQPHLAREVPTIALDRPGFGHSRPARGPVWLLDAQARALRAAVQALGHRRYFLCGHSYGGALALDWALRYPDEVLGVCTIGGVAMDWGGALSGHYRLGGLPLVGLAVARLAPLLGSDRRIAVGLERLFAPQPVPRGYAQLVGAELALRPSTFRINARAMHALHAQVVANQPAYGRILCPVEIVHGEADTTVPASVHAEPLSQALPDVRLTLLPGVGHMPHHAAPGEVLAALRRLRQRAGATRPMADDLSAC
ncbi:MAG TPA: alpha/beta fold hydrolase [Thermohalobaculum sp.]|nr:alpha/beta fold hydrolase [Thermohalobaculum sp.]